MKFTEETSVRTGETDGIKWALELGPSRAFVNGYAQIPEGHPWFDLDYDDIEAAVPGGLTFGPDADGWVGFDTAHYGDFWTDAALAEAGGSTEHAWIVRRRKDVDDRGWTLDALQAYTSDLARQIAEAGK